MLTAYLTATRRLLQTPAAPESLYATADLTDYINTARGQLAGESESIRVMGSLPLIASQRVYNFSAIDISAGGVGVAGIINVRQLWYVVQGGQLWLRPRPFEWLSIYGLSRVVPEVGPPKSWAQYAQGVTGSLYFDPIPDTAYTAPADCVCYPVPLVDDSTVEVIPYLWTDAVPYYAAYMALLGAQSTARQQDGKRYFDAYTEFVNRARRFSTPSVLPGQYAQQPSQVRANQLGIQPQGNG